MLRISKIVSSKLIETSYEFLYTGSAPCFSNGGPAYTRNTKSPVLFPLPKAHRQPAMKVKALVIFMGLMGLVIFDAEGPALLPLKMHSALQAVHHRSIFLSEGALKRRSSEAVAQASYFVHTKHKAIINPEISSSPTNDQNARPAGGRAPPLCVRDDAALPTDGPGK